LSLEQCHPTITHLDFPATALLLDRRSSSFIRLLVSTQDKKIRVFMIGTTTTQQQQQQGGGGSGGMGGEGILIKQEELFGHKKIPTSLVLSPDCRFVVSSGRDGLLIIRDAETFSPVSVFSPHSFHYGGVVEVLFSANSKYLFTAGGGKCLSVSVLCVYCVLAMCHTACVCVRLSSHILSLFPSSSSSFVSFSRWFCVLLGSVLSLHHFCRYHYQTPVLCCYSSACLESSENNHPE
jgi:WD40 repeat protein